MLLFVDAEFADVHARELVSLALVSEDGAFEFYAERDPLPSSPTEFVRSVVYPLLDRGEQALVDEEFTKALRGFFARVQAASRHGKVCVAYDFEGDIHLTDYALDGFKVREPPTGSLFDVVYLGLLGPYELAVDELFEKNKQLAARRHHALIDARVARDAYVAIRRALPGYWGGDPHPR